MDPQILAYYYQSVPGSVLVNDSSSKGISYNFPCNATLPDLTLYIGNGTAIYRSSLLNYGTVDAATNSKSYFQSTSLHVLQEILTLEPHSVLRPPQLLDESNRPAWKYGRSVLCVSFRSVQSGRAGGILCAVVTVSRHSWYSWES